MHPTNCNANACMLKTTLWQHPRHLDLTYVKKFNLTAPQSALTTTCVISDINAVSYPEGVSSPNPMLNQHANENGKFQCVSTLDLLSTLSFIS